MTLYWLDGGGVCDVEDQILTHHTVHKNCCIAILQMNYLLHADRANRNDDDYNKVSEIHGSQKTAVLDTAQMLWKLLM
jgi:predicted alpha/beta superfamily hydrolase